MALVPFLPGQAAPIVAGKLLCVKSLYSRTEWGDEALPSRAVPGGISRHRMGLWRSFGKTGAL